MKKVIVIASVLVLMGGLASAQEKRLESNLLLGAGPFLESGTPYLLGEPGIVLRASYGLDVRFGEHWSVMPGAGIRIQWGDIRHFGWVGGDPDVMIMSDVFVAARYHFESEGLRTIVGLGPALSRMVSPDTYYIDADPMDPLNDKEKFYRYDLGLQPSMMFLQGRHFQWGVEANIGLLNAMRQYPEYNRTGFIHLHYVAVTCGWHF